MNSKLDEMLDQMLDKYEYAGKKLNFKKRFKRVCHHMALSDLFHRLGDHQKYELENKLKNESVPGGMKRMLEDMFEPGEYARALYGATQRAYDRVFVRNN